MSKTIPINDLENKGKISYCKAIVNSIQSANNQYKWLLMPKITYKCLHLVFLHCSNKYPFYATVTFPTSVPSTIIKFKRKVHEITCVVLNRPLCNRGLKGADTKFN
jgi:hypothetical protein